MEYFSKANDALIKASELTDKNNIVYAICKNIRGFFYIPYNEKESNKWFSFANTSSVIKEKRGITIVIAYHNEGQQILDTIKSIYQTADRFIFNIILVNDCSSDYRTGDRFKNFVEVKYIYNNIRLGVGKSLTKGAYLAETPYLFLMGSDIRFRKNNWLQNMIIQLSKEENKNTLICTSCLVMRQDKLDIHNEFVIKEKGEIYFESNDADKLSYKFRKLQRQSADDSILVEGNQIKRKDKVVGKFNSEKSAKIALEGISQKNKNRKYIIANYFAENNGAKINLFMDNETNPKKGDEFKNIIEAQWLRDSEINDMGEIPCILGAAYGVNTEWFKHIKGWELHIFWGTLEPYISLKSYLFGGNCKVAKHIKTGHIFKRKSSHRTSIKHLIYNKLMVAFVLFPTDFFNVLSNHISKNNSFAAGMELFNSHKKELLELKVYCENNKKSSIFDILNYNKIPYMKYFNKNNIVVDNKVKKEDAVNKLILSEKEQLRAQLTEKGIKFKKNNSTKTLKRLLEDG